MRNSANKRGITRRRTGLTVSLAVAAVTASAMAVAGPFCNNGYRGAGPAMNPYSPMGPGPQAYYGAPTRPMGTMAAPGGWRMPANNYPGGYAQQAAPAPARTATTARDQGESAADKVTVHIDGMQFEPSVITVKPGTTVTWVHKSNMPHTVNGGAGEMRSKTMYKGQTYSFTFDKAGSYDYSCDFHPGMKGSVVVEGGGTRT
ncbi:MAG: cupredoxin family copper-binding protein [Gammaproteobacteria bacterium]|nr:cupredoxin family copper-binding protein [Gammaproteobacteria bacterium]